MYNGFLCCISLSRNIHSALFTCRLLLLFILFSLRLSGNLINLQMLLDDKENLPANHSWNSVHPLVALKMDYFAVE